ncbi:MAG: hypothetical protein SGI77_15985 [Pirellulaceae bacterium]|nr:hypothetical protein [Pirellulaceae bacterium]
MLSHIRFATILVLAIIATSSVAQAQRFGLGSRLGNVVSVQDNSAGGLRPGEFANWIPHSTWGDYWAKNQAAQRPWHGDYYYLKTGQPTALIVPPTVTMQSNFSWGVSQNTMTPVYHQFGQGPASGAGGGMFKATPYWPSHTDQFGIYPIRGPW